MPSSSEAVGYAYENVGITGTPSREAVAYVFENVGALLVPSPEGAGYLCENVVEASAPAAPVLSGAAESTQAILSWSDPGNVTSYAVYRDGVLLQGGLTGTSYTDTGLTNGTSYAYHVVAANSVGSSPASNTVSLTPVVAAPALVGAVGTSQVTLDWDEPAGATSYDVYRDGVLLVAGLTTSTYTDTGLTNGVTYSYYVIALDATSTSAPSNTFALTPTEAPPLPFDCTNWPPDDSPALVPYSTQARSDSAALLSDGRVLYCFAFGNEIRQGYAASEQSFYANNSITNVTTLFTGTRPSCCVWRHPTTGAVYLFTARGEVGPQALEWRVEVWRSISGLGGDWVLRGTIDAPTFAAPRGPIFAAYDQRLGEPFVTSSGRWVLPAVRYHPVGTNEWFGMRQPIYTSDDNGASWVMREDLGYYMGDLYGEGQGRNIASWAGALHHSTTGNVNAEKSSYSTDGGTTWAMYQWPATYQQVNYVSADDGFLYFTRTEYSGPLRVYRTTTPTDTTASGYALHRTYASMPGGGTGTLGMGVILQRLGLSCALMQAGRVLGVYIPRAGFAMGSMVMT
jgi:hypothetical protein